MLLVHLYRPMVVNEQQVIEILMDTADGAFATDSRGRVVAWNPGAERITGRGAGETLGRPCWEVVNGRDPLGNLVCFPDCHVMAMAVRGEQPSHHDLVVDGRGKELSLDFSTTLVRDEEWKTRAIVHTFRDVTERRRIETHLRQALGDQPTAKEEIPESAGRLTIREKEILKLLSSGLSTQAMAKRLSLSRATVRNHVQNILSKLGVHSKLEAVVLAQRYHLA